MFDIAFSELVVIGVVALVVIGPEKLPKVAKTAGILLGRAQKYVADIKTDLNRQIQFEELKALQAQIAEQARAMETTVKKQMLETEAALTQGTNNLKTTVEEAGREISASGQTLASEVTAAVQAASAPASRSELPADPDELFRGEPAYLPPQPAAQTLTQAEPDTTILPPEPSPAAAATATADRVTASAASDPQVAAASPSIQA